MPRPAHDPVTPDRQAGPPVLRRLIGLAASALLIAELVDAFAGIVAFAAGLTVMALYAASHATPPQRPSGSAASGAWMRAAGPPGTRR